MFESGYSIRLYQILENDVVDFLNYIPIDYYLGEKKKQIFSPKIAELLVRIGSQVDIFFRYWDIVHEVYIKKYNPKKFKLNDLDMGYFKDIERENKIILSNKEIKIISTDEIIIPFEFFSGDRRYPLFWNAYNHVKHNGFTNKKEGNLFNVIESLAALFLLNCVHEKTQNKLAEHGFISIRNRELFEQLDFDMKRYPYSYITSKIFEFNKN
ncbi:MAG: hypothetical protein OIN83_08325 [Candidatus Methanoperedens sp.]|nr:hypothetical protein [Candidatus Methanoperedens sp.]